MLRPMLAGKRPGRQNIAIVRSVMMDVTLGREVLPRQQEK